MDLQRGAAWGNSAEVVLVQRPQNPSTGRPHRPECCIGLGVAIVDLNSIPAVNDLPVFYEHGKHAGMPVFLETNTRHPGPAFQRAYPTKSRYCERIQRCEILQGVL